MQLATCKDGKPWLCSVWYVMDEAENIYFISKDSRRHSQELANNPNVCVTIVSDIQDKKGGQGQSLTVNGKGETVRGNHIQQVYRLYSERFPELADMPPIQKFENEDSHFFYKVTPEEIVWFDQVNFPEQPKRIVR
jgi:uncharacterized protein YhbP (UPF0306 family)